MKQKNIYGQELKLIGGSNPRYKICGHNITFDLVNVIESIPVRKSSNFFYKI